MVQAPERRRNLHHFEPPADRRLLLEERHLLLVHGYLHFAHFLRGSDLVELAECLGVEGTLTYLNRTLFVRDLILRVRRVVGDSMFFDLGQERRRSHSVHRSSRQFLCGGLLSVFIEGRRGKFDSRLGVLGSGCLVWVRNIV